MNQKIFMIAGPNGAGKTTTARPLILYSSVIYEYINADEIARGLAPMHPEKVALTASKLMIRQLDELLINNKNIAFETTAAGTNYIKHIERAKSQGYEFIMVFLWLSSPELAIQRVAHRVSQGGHFIPDEVVKRRYLHGIKNFVNFYLPLADRAAIFDNSQFGDNKLVAVKQNVNLTIKQPNVWKTITA